MFQLHHTSVSSLHHVYCAVLSSFTMGIISVLSSSQQIDVLLSTRYLWYDSDLFSMGSSEVDGTLALVSFLPFIISGWGVMVQV